MNQLNLIESLFFFTIIFWIVGLGFSFLFQSPRPYWNWTTRTLRSFFENYWRYIVVFGLGYYLANEDFFRLTVPW